VEHVHNTGGKKDLKLQLCT